MNLGDYSCVVEQVYGSPSVKVEQQINVAVRAMSSACGRAEEREVPHPQLLEAGRSRAKNADNRGKLSRARSGGRRGRVEENGAARKQGDPGCFKSLSDGSEIGRNGLARGVLKMSDGEPGNAGLPGQLSLGEAEKSAARAAHFRRKRWVGSAPHIRQFI
ncbi:MAG TPA: hypothetical protein VMV27_00190 [Candidatus Binataceae bacterium]|nr:hypothetical protein [Candidatus Binataceae bacterium]